MSHHIYDTLKVWLLNGGVIPLDVWAQMVTNVDTTRDAIRAQSVIGEPKRITRFNATYDSYAEKVYIEGDKLEFAVEPHMVYVAIKGAVLFDRIAGQCLAFIEGACVLTGGPVFLALETPRTATTPVPAAKSVVCDECRGTGTVDLLFKIVPCKKCKVTK